MLITQGKKYQATLKLGLFEQIASNAQVAEQFKAAGFKDVQVSGSGSTRTATGTWAGLTTDAALPSQVKEVREIA